MITTCVHINRGLNEQHTVIKIFHCNKFTLCRLVEGFGYKLHSLTSKLYDINTDKQALKDYVQ